MKAQYLGLRDELDEAIHGVLEKGNYVMGEEVESFEEEWAKYCCAKYCVGLSSGTDSLYLTLLALLGEVGEDVITTPLTFFATTQSIIKSGNNPVFMDVDETGNLPYVNFEDKVALVVHMNGRPGSWNGDYVIEDAAQAHGCILNGYATCFSFYPSKNLGAVGQAGAVVTNDPFLAEVIREMRNHGERGRFIHYRMTGNHRMDELQAAILRVKMRHLDDWNSSRRRIASRYRLELSDCEKIFIPPDTPGWFYHIFPVLCSERDGLAEYLKESGIQVSMRYPLPIHLQPVLIKSLHYKRGDFPMAEKWCEENLSLPIYPEMPEGDVDYVIEKVKEWCEI